MDLIGLYLFEPAILCGDSYILFLRRKFKELNPGAQSLLQATRRHKLRSYSESPTTASSLHAPVLESALSKQVSRSLFVHIGMKILLSVTRMGRCLKCSHGPGLWGHTAFPPRHMRNTAGARGGADIPCHVNLTSASRHRNWLPLRCHGCCPDHHRKENNSTNTLCLLTKSRQYGIAAALPFAKSQPDCMAGN